MFKFGLQTTAIGCRFPTYRYNLTSRDFPSRTPYPDEVCIDFDINQLLKRGAAMRLQWLQANADEFLRCDIMFNRRFGVVGALAFSAASMWYSAVQADPVNL